MTSVKIFISKSVANRFDFVKWAKLCLKYFCENYGVSGCTSKNNCKIFAKGRKKLLFVLFQITAVVMVKSHHRKELVEFHWLVGLK